MIEATVYPPECMTKQLRLQPFENGQKRKIVISTNWLTLFGFDEEARYKEYSLGIGKGIVVKLENAPGTKKVYTRTYKSRKNNPLETLLDIRSQQLLNESIPQSTEKVHIIFQWGKIYITPINNKQAERIEQVQNAEDAFTAFAACSSGVDALSLSQEGFSVQSVLEWRPPEKRDKARDLSETGMLNFLSNSSGLKHAFNEDINYIDVKRVARAISDSKNTLFQVSLQCDDYSPLKTKNLKEASLEDLSTSSDMVYDALRIIEECNFPMILLEQVKSFMTDPAGRIFETKLRRWGYTVYKAILNSRDHGGLTNRERYYCFATALPNPFTWPEATPRREIPLWDNYIAPALPRLREVSHSKSLQDGLTCGRLRIIDRNSSFSGTILKSQDRMAKDSVVIMDDDGRLFFPDLELIKQLMRIPDEFRTDINSSTIGTEIIGQSVDFELHSRVSRQIVLHLQQFLSQKKEFLAA